MATDTLEIFGTEYSGVTGIKATDSNNTTKTYIRPQGTKSITSSGTTDVTAYASASVPNASWGESSESIVIEYGEYRVARTYPNFSAGWVAEDDGYYFSIDTEQKSVTPSESSQTVTPTSNLYYLDEVSVGAISSTYVGSGITQRDSSDLSASGATVTAPSGYYASSATKTISSGSATPASSISATGASVTTGTNTLTLSKTVSNTPQVSAGYVSAGTAGNSSVSLTASVTTKAAATIYPGTTDQTIASGTYLTGTQTVKALTQTNLSAENIKSGTTISVNNGQSNVWSVTGTYSGGGGSSKNVQISQSTTRISSSSLTKVNGDLTVSKTGTYDIYWSAGRSNTSTSYTWGTRLYVDSSGYGTENTTWNNSVQNNHLSNVSLTVNQKLAVYARGRTGSYYTFAPMLVIIEA